MHKFVRSLITEWRRLGLPTANGTVVVAVSGGADSVSLLLALCELNRREKLDLRLVAAHFNHELRDGESDKDEEFVRELTVKHKIEFATARAGKLSAEGNLEQNARQARYEFLLSTARNVEAFAVVTGHTINDQAETFLLNLLRGSGPAGLSGMRPIRLLDDEKRNVGMEVPAGDTDLLLPFSSAPLLVRPLLTWAKRIDTESYCVESGVEYRYDTMNEDTAFKRVRIRKILLPLLEDFNPKIVETLARTATLMQDAAGDRIPGEEPTETALAVKELNEMPESDRRQAVRNWLAARRGNTRKLELKHIQAIERLALSTKSGRTAELPGGAQVVKRDGKLVYEENKVEN